MANGGNQVKEAPIWLAHGADIYDLIAPISKRKTVSAEQILIEQGKTVPYIYFVLQGRAQAFIYTRSGQQFWVADFEPGDLFGHPEILSGAPIAFEVKADTDMQLAVLPAKAFSDMMLEAPALGKNVYTELSSSLGRAQTRCLNLRS